MSLATCPTPAELEGLIRGGLANDTLAALEGHVSKCDACATQLASLLDAHNVASWASDSDDSIPSVAVEAFAAQFKARFPLASNLPAQDTPTHSFDTNSIGLVDHRSLTAFLAPAQQADEIGRLGHYRILRVLGHGGMGVVFEAEDTKLKRLVAVKAMLAQVATSTTNATRFRREAEAMAAIAHDHVVRVYHIDEERGVPYFAMELLQGETLEARLDRGPLLSISEVLRIGAEIAHGLAAAHANGLVHRDIKPSNIWLEGQDARVKLLDFGLARVMTQAVQATHQGAIIGTPAYMSPEQGRGGTVDARSDLFSLGLVLYRITTGHPPFPVGDVVATIVALTTQQPIQPSLWRADVPLELDGLILKLLAKAPEDRFATAGDVTDALTQLQTNFRKLTYSKPRSRRRVLVASLVMLCGVLVTLSVWPRPSVMDEPEGEPPHGPIAPEQSPFGLRLVGSGAVVLFPDLAVEEEQPVTIEAWLLNEAAEFRFHLRTSTGAYQLFRRENALRMIYASGTSGAGVHTEVNWAAGTWSHVAGVVNGSIFSMFIDGKRMPTTSVRVSVPRAHNWGTSVGHNGIPPKRESQFPLAGTVALLRYSRGSRYTADFEPRTDWQPDTDTLGLYDFREGHGQHISDRSSHKHHGTITHGEWVPLKWPLKRTKRSE